jgi:hypothetical protein
VPYNYPSGILQKPSNKNERGLGSSVGIATNYGLDGPAIESVCNELSTSVVLVNTNKPVW